MAFGKVIKLFLLDGSPNKRWICELSNWTGVAYKIPRNMIKESESRDELSSPGIYFLFGYDDDKEKPLIYVGEAENIIKLISNILNTNFTELRLKPADIQLTTLIYQLNLLFLKQIKLNWKSLYTMLKFL